MSSTSSTARRLNAMPDAAAPADKDRLDPAHPRDDDLVDEASAESMDASDPPAFGGATGVGAPPPDSGDEDPAGLAAAGGFPDDDDARRRLIERRAYELWDEAGRPQDADQEFWYLAERELDMPEDPTSPAG